MNGGLNYGDANSTDNFVRYIRAVTQVMRDTGMGGTYWPALGGKPGTIGYDWYSTYAKTGSGANANLTIRSASGANRLRWAWGDAVDPNAGNGTGGSSTVRLVNGASAKCIDVVGGSTANNARSTGMVSSRTSPSVSSVASVGKPSTPGPLLP